jgi:hypothetical protein
MPGLTELQAAFARALAGDTRDAASWVVAGPIAPAERLSIYVNNTDAILANYLSTAFPAVERLGGQEYFVGLAREYRRLHPSRSGNLQDVGEGFAHFLGTQLVDTPFAFMADVARLEWAYQEALVAADAAVFEAAALMALPADAHDAVTFTWAPSVRRVASDYPIEAIWEANREGGVETPNLRLDAGGDVLLLHRTGRVVHVRHLDPATDAFVSALLNKRPLVEAVAALEQVDPMRDAGALLLELIQSGRIDGFRPNSTLIQT